MAAASGGNADDNADGGADRPSQGAAWQPEPGPLLREAYAATPIDPDFARRLQERLDAELPATTSADARRRVMGRWPALAALAAGVLALAAAGVWYRGRAVQIAAVPPP